MKTWNYKSRVNTKQTEDIKKAFRFRNASAKNNWRVRS